MSQTDRASAAEAQGTVEDIANAVYDLVITDGPSQLTRLNTIDAGYAGQGTVDNGLGVRRNLVASLGEYGSMMSQALIEWGKAEGVDALETSVSGELFVRLRQYLSDEGPYSGGSVDKKVTARGFSRGSEAAPTGFKVYRLLVDEYGQTIDTGNPQVITLERVSGPAESPHVLNLRGEQEGLDAFELLGSGDDVNITAVNETTGTNTGAGGNVLLNPRLNNLSSTTSITATTQISNWALNDAAEWDGDTTNKFRTNLRSIKTSTDRAYFQQTITNGLDPRTPYLPVVWVYPEAGINSGDGIEIDWGGKSQAFAGLTGDAWNICVCDRDKDLFPVQFDDATNGARFRVTADLDNAGTLHFGAAFLVPGIRINGVWYFVLSDSTDGVAGATATITDTITPAATINHVLPLLYPDEPEAYLPTTGTNLISNLS